MRNKIPVILVLLTLCLVIAFPALANAEPNTPPIETTAESAVLMDYVSGHILFSKEPDLELPMASVTKLMTLLLAVEAVDEGKLDLSDTIVTSEYAASMGGSQVYLEPGEEMSVEEMLISIAVGSANDCSVAMAEHIGGSEENFVKMMNKKVKDMGLNHTHFSNTTGLPIENHYTSAHDMAFILKENLKYPLFKKLSSIYEYDLRGGEFKLWSTNKLLKWYEGADAGKTGWTNDAKYCLASSAKKEGMRLIAVVLGTPEPRSHFRECIKLFNYGFSQYQMVKLQDAGARVKTVDVNKGTVEKLGLVTSKEAGVVVPKGQDEGFRGVVKAPDEITAPVKKGQSIGSYVIMKDGREITKVPLVAENTVPKASILKQMHKALNRIYG
ncbi:MAG: D-alanyl-D-alanine carboxypeptidase [Firmicutes bacterium]|nr:D-alanyl-D-alanine carboxypeptidase [Bacillota bacterium]